ncbi:hypothetical protein PGB90_010460 [Kerria lacca]
MSLFCVQNNIKFDEMKNLALSIESIEKESKARVEETSTIANSVICFRCGRPNHLASNCTNLKRICYNCGKLGSHTVKECTLPKTYFPTNAKFPSGKVGKITSSSHQKPENTFQRVKMTGLDGKEKYVMFSETDGKIYELPETNMVEDSKLASNNKKLHLGQSVTNIVASQKENNSKIFEGTKVQEEGRRVSSEIFFLNSPSDSYQNICDESFDAVVEEEHNNAEKALLTNEQMEECNNKIVNDHICTRSLVQTNKNTYNNEIQESFDDKNIDKNKAKKSFKEVSKMNSTDSGGIRSKNLRNNLGLLGAQTVDRECFLSRSREETTKIYYVITLLAAKGGFIKGTRGTCQKKAALFLD